MLAMYGAWAMTKYLGLNPYYSVVAIVPAMFLFGVLVHRMIVAPALDKPHLVVVFATMGLSILMQNVALMAMSADLLDVPPMLGGRSFSSARSMPSQNCSSASPSRSPAPWRCASCCRRPTWARRSAPPCRTAKPPSSWAFRFPIFLITFAAGSARRSLRLRDDAAVLRVPDRRPQFRAHRVRDRRARRHGQHRRSAARGHLHRHRAIAEQLLYRPGLRADVLLHAVPAGHDLSSAGCSAARARPASASTTEPAWTRRRL